MMVSNLLGIKNARNNGGQKNWTNNVFKMNALIMNNINYMANFHGFWIIQKQEI